MKWFKHDSNASLDAKLEKLRIRYGMEGYGLYWYCLELIVSDIEAHNITFRLEHDADIISHNTRLHIEHVEEMMKYMVDLGLFENNNGIITCYKLLKRLDSSMTSNPKLRELLKESHDKIRLSHDSVMLEENRREENRSMSEKKFSDDDLNFANHMYTKILNVMPKTKKPNFEKWADTIRLMRERDNLSLDEIKAVFNNANQDEFWKTNILSPAKLREHFPRLHVLSGKNKTGWPDGFDPSRQCKVSETEEQCRKRAWEQF